jgi:hypothetical protein
MLSKKDSKYTKNLYAGGLMDDFDFDFKIVWPFSLLNQGKL